MLLQSANELGLQLPNAALGLATQQQTQKQTQMNTSPVDFYSERTVESNKTETRENLSKNVEKEDILDEVLHKFLL